MKKIFLLSLLLIFSCNNNEEAKIEGRWYTASQVKIGEKVYEQNCMQCHMPKGVGTPNWKEKLADGSYPPPPLDNSAHAWHHPYKHLMDMISNGGSSYGGRMPAFKDKLSLKEKEAVIAYIHSLWPDETYKHWQEKINKNDF